MNDQVGNKLSQAKNFIRNQRGGTIAPNLLSEEEINPQTQDDQSYQARALEAKNRVYPVNFSFPEDSLCSELSFFEDGRQRTINIGFITTNFGSRTIIVPVHFFVVGTVILQRDQDQKLNLWNQPILKTGIIVERSLVPDQAVINDFEKQGLEIVDVKAQGGDYSNLRMRALQRAKNLRLEIETSLIGQWRQSEGLNNRFLVVDGTLMNFRNEDNVEKCIGVSKSFGTRYFESSDHNKILQMNEFERSWTFRFHEEGEDTRLGVRERVSWYLRLRRRVNTDPEFGLIRVEISQRHMERATEYAERISRSLLSERFPTSYPTPRWDKHLYPIRECENYLSSIMPSTSTIVASMKG